LLQSRRKYDAETRPTLALYKGGQHEKTSGGLFILAANRGALMLAPPAGAQEHKDAREQAPAEINNSQRNGM
jgi:hypothetical protein